MIKQHIIYKNLEHARVELVATEIDEYIHCLYLWLYPGHSLFDGVVDNDYFKYDAGFDWHGGATFGYFGYRQNGSVAYKKVGCDYNHGCDERFGMELFCDEVMDDFNSLVEYAVG